MEPGCRGRCVSGNPGKSGSIKGCVINSCRATTFERIDQVGPIRSPKVEHELRKSRTRESVRQRGKLRGERMHVRAGNVESRFVSGKCVQVGSQGSAKLPPIELAVGIRKI